MTILAPVELVTGQQQFGALPHDNPSTSSLGQCTDGPRLSGVVCQLPEVTFTPTSAGLQADDGQQSRPNLDVQSVISEAISKILAVTIQQGTKLSVAEGISAHQGRN